MPKLSASTKLFIGLFVLAGTVCLVLGLMKWDCKDLLRFGSFLVIAALASRLKVTLPGINGSLSVNVPFFLLAAVELSLGEALVITAVSTLVQCLPFGGKRMHPVQAMFNISTLLVAVAVTATLYQRSMLMMNSAESTFMVAVSGLAYLVANTLPVSIVIALTEKKNAVQVWFDIFGLTFPYFVLSAATAAVAAAASHYTAWEAPLVLLPVMAGVYHSYNKYFSKPQPATLISSAAAAD